MVMDDETLCQRLAGDLDGTFEALVIAHQDRLFSIALRLLGDAADAEEVAQDSLVRAYRAMCSYGPGRIRSLHLRAWLTTITVNAAHNRRRRLADRAPAVPLAVAVERGVELIEDDAAGPEASHERRATRATWARLVTTLPERYRVPVVLRHVDDLSYAEMAEVLGRPEGTLKAQVHRGLAMLRAAASSEREELTA